MTSLAPNMQPGFRATFMPLVGFRITAPAPMLQSARFRRINNRASKEAMRTTLKNHRLARIPKHFEQPARHKYAYHPREDKYKAFKRRRFGSITDLKKTGRTKQFMMAQVPRIQVGGSAEGTLRGRLFLRFPFPVARVQDSQGVTPEKMAEEIERWILAEQQQAAEEYGRFYLDVLEEELASAPRLRKTLQPEINALRARLS